MNCRNTLLRISHQGILLVLLLFICGCSSDPDSNSPDSQQVSEMPVETIVPAGTENFLTKSSDYIFDQNRLHTFELNLPQEALSRIDTDPAAEQYVEGSLTFEGETLSPIGIRYKGSIGAFVGCVSGSDWTNPSGSKTCTKLSMKVKVNWLDSDDKFYGLKKLQFHSQNLDPSQMRDRLGYWLFGAMGVPAPRSVHARLVINGTYSGVYSLVEQVDGRFARYHFDDGKGNLYKEVWPLNSQGQVQSEQEFLRNLETNEDEDPTAEMIRSFGQEIVSADDTNIQNVIAKWMNVDEIMSFVVVDRLIRVDDGPFHWYCGGNECTNHNYYWYEEPTERTMHLIPWDLDNAFENIVSDRNPVTPIADEWGEITANCSPFSYGAIGIRQRSAACDKLTAGWASFTGVYQEKKLEFLNGPFEESVVDELIDSWAAQIRDATEEASRIHNDALSISRWEQAIAELKASLRYARTQ